MNNIRYKNYAIILAAGTGERFKNKIPKQFIKICGKEILAITAEDFQNSELIDEIIITTNPEYEYIVHEIVQKYNLSKVKKIIIGGKTRKDSSYNSVMAIDDTQAKVLIHDGARPFVSQKIISDCIKALDKFQAVTTAIPLTDTIIEVKDDIIESTPNRDNYMRVQTPQGFNLQILKKAHTLSINDNNFTDDCGLIIKHKLCDVHIINGDINNIKITYPQDIDTAEKIFFEQNS